MTGSEPAGVIGAEVTAGPEDKAENRLGTTGMPVVSRQQWLLRFADIASDDTRKLHWNHPGDGFRADMLTGLVMMAYQTEKGYIQIFVWMIWTPGHCWMSGGFNAGPTPDGNAGLNVLFLWHPSPLTAAFLL